MSFAITLVASDQSPALTDRQLAPLRDVLEEIGPWRWLAPGRACDAVGKTATTPPPAPEKIEALRQICDPLAVDIFVTGAENRRKSLLVADMESTMVAFEALEEIAVFLNLKEKIKEITDRAMNGELDFHQALAERVSLLQGVPLSALETVREAMKTTINPGAAALVSTMKAAGARCILVTGGFSFFAQWVAQTLGFDACHANSLDLQDGKLSGTLSGPVLGPEAKRDCLQSYCRAGGITPAEAMTIGDGANDIPMLQAAQEAGGLGVGYHPKPAIARAGIINRITHGDLSAALFAQGYAAPFPPPPR